jgi:tetratricopeptide (TPR) repeat protein
MASTGSQQEGRRSLDVFEFGTLLQVLAQSNKAGTLRVMSGSKLKLISLEGGQITRILTPQSRFRIGRILYNLGAVELPDLKRVLDEVSNTAEPIGEALLSRDLIQRESLDAALQYQMVEELLDVFYWKDLNYEFFEGEAQKEVLAKAGDLTAVGGRCEAQSLLLEVTRVLDETEKFRSATPSSHDVYETVGDPAIYLEQEGAPDRERETTLLIDGVRDLSEVVRDARMPRFEVRGLFFRLKSAGILRPKNAFELLMLAENMKDTLSPTKRAHLLERAMKLGLDGFDLAQRLAEIYVEMGDGPRAASRFIESAREMIRRGNRTAACESAVRAIAADPTNTVVREFRARLLGESNADEEMIGEVLMTAKLHADKGRPDEADRLLRAAVSKVGEDHRLLSARIDALRRLGKTKAAAAAALALARRLEVEGDMDGALTALRRAVGIQPDSFRPRTAHIDLLIRMGDRNMAASEIGDLSDIAVRWLEKKPARALKVLDSLARRLSEIGAVPSAAMENIASHYLTLGEKERALSAFVRTGEARIAAGMWGEARDAMRRATELDPGDVDLSETLALIHARMGNREHAIRRLTAIATLLMRSNKIERAEKAIREILRLNPFSPEALRELASLRSRLGRVKEAAELLHRLGHLLWASGNLEEATEAFDEACGLDPENVNHVRDLASCLSRMLKTRNSLGSFDDLLTRLRANGDHLGALEIALRMLRIDPDHGAAKRIAATEYRLLGERVRTIVGDGAVGEDVELPVWAE